MDVAVFCVIYMQARFPRRIYGITVLPVLQASLLGIALLVGLSRISGYKHHWSDIVVGFLVGSAIGCYSAVILGKVFKRSDATSPRKQSWYRRDTTRKHDSTSLIRFSDGSIVGDTPNYYIGNYQLRKLTRLFIWAISEEEKSIKITPNATKCISSKRLDSRKIMPREDAQLRGIQDEMDRNSGRYSLILL
uniref:Phosphatidic acid phosphatase type 2/haloperoxidase domain-containing protein n=1 Tax=Parascaris univalens TaxID=6257 RepID=A0A914ZNG5_PARUN